MLVVCSSVLLVCMMWLSVVIVCVCCRLWCSVLVLVCVFSVSVMMECFRCVLGVGFVWLWWYWWC